MEAIGPARLPPPSVRTKMVSMTSKPLSRRELLRTAAPGAALILLPRCGSSASHRGSSLPDAGLDAGAEPDAARELDAAAELDAARELDATASCEETEEDIEGPYYEAGAPERADLVEVGMLGTRLTIRGRVLGTDCTPL